MISIRRSARNDLAQLMKLHRRASEFHGGLDNRLAPGSDAPVKFESAVQAMLGSKRYPVFVAASGRKGTLPGCIIAKVVDNRPFAVLEYGYVSCLYVDEGWRGRQVGRRLLEAALDWFRSEGLGVVQADVAHRNVVGRGFWEKMGFTDFLDHLCCTVQSAPVDEAHSRVLVREATVADTTPVLSLWREMMDYHTPLDHRLRVLRGARGHIAQVIGQWLWDDSTRLLVAEAEGTVVGFSLGGVVDTALGLKPARYGHIAHICVTGRWRRHGIGRQLFATLRDWFQTKGLGSIHVYVSDFNRVSQRFWRSLGFEDYVDRLWYDLE